jgi:hypothetical protein
MTFGMWAAVLPTIMDADDFFLTEGYYGAVVNPNLYFSSWGATIYSFFILTGFAQEQVQKMRTGSETSTTFQYGGWAALTMTSVIAMMAAMRQFDDMDCANVESDSCELDFIMDCEFASDLCDRTSFAVSLGAISGLVALLWMVLGWCVNLNTILDTLLASILLAAWCFGVSYITFGGRKAAAPLMSNLYFFTWGSFAMTCHLVATGVFNVIGSFTNGGTVDEAGGDGEEMEKKEMEQPNEEEAEPAKEEVEPTKESE